MARRPATRACSSGSRRSTASRPSGSSPPTARCRPTRSCSSSSCRRATSWSSRPPPTTARCSRCASSAPRSSPSRSRRTGSTSMRSPRRSTAGARPTLAHIIPNFQNPAGCTLSLEKRRRLLELAAAARLHDLRGRPVRGAPLRGRAAPDDARAGRRRGPGRLRVLVLEDGLPGDPRGLPGGRHRPDRRRAQARHGAPTSRRTWWPRRSWPSSVTRARSSARSRRSRRRSASAATPPAPHSCGTCPTRASSLPRGATSSGSTCPRAAT